MWLYHRVMSSNGTDGMANSVDSDLGLPCLARLVCPKTYENYGIILFYDLGMLRAGIELLTSSAQTLLQVTRASMGSLNLT